ncbi:hypothetical protein VNO77_32851 [Canavalia gladiata]|uniref:FLZ-type domain-containing protein n=1 Tax=Canavalia gladiata TaxID=3824 RepID=A0AAN9PX82_CANGL
MKNSNCNSSNPQRNRNRNRNRMILEGGVVGLGIVAAMINNSTDIVSSAKPAANFRGTTTYASPLNIRTYLLFPTPHFLNSCNLCHKHLHGVDIFIYRGERAFCSAECRETHISNDDYQELDKFKSRVIKTLDCSIPPCSASPVPLPHILAA